MAGGVGRSRALYTRLDPIGWQVAAGAGQDQLMQRGPIVAGPAEGMQLCWPLPRGSSGEGVGGSQGRLELSVLGLL